MAQLRIKIGAAADQRSFDVVFGRMEKRGERAAKKIAKDWDKTFAAMEKRAQKAGQNIDKALSGKKTRGGSASDHARPAVEGAQKATREIEREIRRRVSEERAAMRRLSAEKIRNIRREESEKRRALKRTRDTQEADRSLRNFAYRTSHRATRFLQPNAPILGMAANFGRGVLNGAGLDLSFGGGIARNMATETSLIDAINSARAGGQEIAFDDAKSTVREISNRYGMSREDTTSGVLEFQKKTGDLGLGFEISDQLAKLAVATGTEFADMANAAGDVSNVLGDVPNKGKRIIDVFETIAGQGAKGAVEISDLASGMAKLGAAASKFEGDAGDNLKKMGALAQFARATGGAASASEAANAVARFSDQLSTPARMREFKAAGVDLYSKDSPGQLLDPFEIIKNSLAATKGDPGKLSKLFASSIGKKPVQAMSKTFLEAGGATNPEAGLAALDKMIAEQMQGAAMGKDVVDKNLEQALGTTARTVQRLNNQWDDTVEEMQRQLVPALQEATPSILEFGKTVGKVATWTVENPKRAIAAAIGVSIARAGVESALRTAIDKAIMAGAPAIQGAFASQLGQLFSGVGAVTLAIAVAKIHVDNLMDEEKDGQVAQGQDDADQLRWVKHLEEKKANGELSPEDEKWLREHLMSISGRVDYAKKREDSPVVTTVTDFWNSSLSTVLGDNLSRQLGVYTSEDVGRSEADQVMLDELRQRESKLIELLSRDLPVRITNPQDIGFDIPDNGPGPAGKEIPVPGYVLP